MKRMTNKPVEVWLTEPAVSEYLLRGKETVDLLMEIAEEVRKEAASYGSCSDEPYTVTVDAKDDNGEVVRDEDGKPVKKTIEVEDYKIVARTEGVKTRASVKVVANTRKARNSNLKHNSLLKAVQAVGGRHK